MEGFDFSRTLGKYHNKAVANALCVELVKRWEEKNGRSMGDLRYEDANLIKTIIVKKVKWKFGRFRGLMRQALRSYENSSEYTQVTGNFEESDEDERPPTASSSIPQDVMERRLQENRRQKRISSVSTMNYVNIFFCH